MTTRSPIYDSQPMPGQVVRETLRAKLRGLDKAIRDAEEALTVYVGEVSTCQGRIAELKAAHAEIADFLAKEAAKA